MRNNGFNPYLQLQSRRFHSLSTPWRFKFYKTIAIVLAVTLLSYFIILSRLNHMRQRQMILTQDSSSHLYQEGKLIGSPLCKLPYLPIDNPDIMKFIKSVPPIQCVLPNGAVLEDWVQVNGTHAVLTQKAKEMYGPNIKCRFNEIDRIHDSLSRLSTKGEVEGEVYGFTHSDFVRVTCTSSFQVWKSYLAGIRSTISVPRLTAHTSNVPLLNVLIWGHDSVSRNMFMRKLPKTYTYLTEQLEGIVLKGYNIVGDGTPQALIPILTGQTELELPETRKRKETAQFVNVYPFVWDEYQTQGYLTGYLEDSPTIGTFNFRLKGFRNTPTDFYMRPFFLAAEPHYSEFPQYCIGGLPRHKIMMNYVKHILEFRKDKPKFIFSLHSELSHGDVNSIEGVDDDLKRFMKEDLKGLFFMYSKWDKSCAGVNWRTYVHAHFAWYNCGLHNMNFSVLTSLAYDQNDKKSYSRVKPDLALAEKHFMFFLDSCDISTGGLNLRAEYVSGECPSSVSTAIGSLNLKNKMHHNLKLTKVGTGSKRSTQV